MRDHENHSLTAPQRAAWNKGKLIGAKPPLRPKHVWSIRTKLQVEGRVSELAMFNVANLRAAGRKPGEFLFPSRRNRDRVFRPGNIHGLCPTGSRASGWMQIASVHIRCGELKQP